MIDHTSAGDEVVCLWFTVWVLEVEVLDGVIVMDASVDNIFVCSIIFVSVFKIPLRSEAVGVDIRSSVLLIVEAATIYDWLVCWIVLGGSFVFGGLMIFPFVFLFLFAAATVASIKAGLVTHITGPGLIHTSISAKMGIGIVPSTSSILRRLDMRHKYIRLV